MNDSIWSPDIYHSIAETLADERAYGIHGQLAEAILLTLAGNRGPAVDHLAALETGEEAVVRMVRALTARNTGDYRALSQVANRCPFEDFAWFFAWADYVSPPVAWDKLADSQKTTVDYVRAAHQTMYSVEMGHELLRAAIPLELQEIESVYPFSHDAPLDPKDLVEALNVLPERCFTRGPKDDVRVRVIGWGQGATFLQRHLCHAVQKNFGFMYGKWGVRDAAEEFAAECERQFAGLRLYPFVQRINCTTQKAYRESVDAAFELIESTPHLVPAGCWNFVWFRARVGPYYSPKPSPLLDEWFSYNPLPGTVFDLGARLDHPNLARRFDAVEFFEGLHLLAPYDVRLSSCIAGHRDDDGLTHQEALDLYGPVLPYCVYALRVLAGTVYDQPEAYGEYMLQAAQLNPTCYYTLGDYFRDRDQGQGHEAAQYYDIGCDLDPDAVRIASHATWRVQYYLETGEQDKAREIADHAGNVYSSKGLSAKAAYWEGITNDVEAFEWYAKIEDRYDMSGPLIAFCLRYKERTGDARFADLFAIRLCPVPAVCPGS